MPRSKKIKLPKANKQTLYDITKDNTEEHEVDNILPIENLEIKELSVKKPKSNKYNNYNGKGKINTAALARRGSESPYGLEKSGGVNDMSPTSDVDLEELIKKRVADSLLQYDNKKEEERKIKLAEKEKIKQEKLAEKERLKKERIDKKNNDMKEIILNEISTMRPQIQQELTQAIINNRINEVNNLRSTLFKGTTLRW